MGSVIIYIECPFCKQENCMEDFYYKTGENYINCPDCGFHQSFHYKRSDDGTFLRKDETKGYEFGNLIGEFKQIDTPYGAYEIKYTNNGAQCGTLATEEDYNKFVSEVNSLDELDNIRHVTVSRHVNGKIEKEIILDNLK